MDQQHSYAVGKFFNILSYYFVGNVLRFRHFHDKAAVDYSVNEAKALLSSDSSQVPISNRLVRPLSLRFIKI